MKRLPMRKIREALRLKAQGLSQRKIATSLGVARSTVGDHLARAELAGLTWPLPDDLCDVMFDKINAAADRMKSARAMLVKTPPKSLMDLTRIALGL